MDDQSDYSVKTNRNLKRKKYSTDEADSCSEDSAEANCKSKIEVLYKKQSRKKIKLENEKPKEREKSSDTDDSDFEPTIKGIKNKKCMIIESDSDENYEVDKIESNINHEAKEYISNKKEEGTNSDDAERDDFEDESALNSKLTRRGFSKTKKGYRAKSCDSEKIEGNCILEQTEQKQNVDYFSSTNEEQNKSSNSADEKGVKIEKEKEQSNTAPDSICVKGEKVKIKKEKKKIKTPSDSICLEKGVTIEEEKEQSDTPSDFICLEKGVTIEEEKEQSDSPSDSICLNTQVKIKKEKKETKPLDSICLKEDKVKIKKEKKKINTPSDSICLGKGVTIEEEKEQSDMPSESVCLNTQVKIKKEKKETKPLDSICLKEDKVKIKKEKKKINMPLDSICLEKGVTIEEENEQSNTPPDSICLNTQVKIKKEKKKINTPLDSICLEKGVTTEEEKEQSNMPLDSTFLKEENVKIKKKKKRINTPSDSTCLGNGVEIEKEKKQSNSPLDSEHLLDENEASENENESNGNSVFRKFTKMKKEAEQKSLNSGCEAKKRGSSIQFEKKEKISKLVTRTCSESESEHEMNLKVPDIHSNIEDKPEKHKRLKKSVKKKKTKVGSNEDRGPLSKYLIRKQMGRLDQNTAEDFDIDKRESETQENGGDSSDSGKESDPIFSDSDSDCMDYSSKLSYKPTREEQLFLINLQVQLQHKVPPQHRLERRAGTRHLKKALKTEFEKHATLQRGYFSTEEDNIVKKNWKTFCKIHNWDPKNPKPFLQMKHKGKVFYVSQVNRLKFVQFLAKGLPNRCLYSVYNRFKLIYCKHKTSRYQSYEDAVILDFIKKQENNRKKDKNDRKFADLALILNRTRASVWRRYRLLVRNMVSNDCDHYSSE